MGEQPAWVEKLFSAVRCANCNSPYGKNGIALVGRREDFFFVHCNCEACGTAGLGVVIVRDAPASLVAPVAVDYPLSVDDVLDVHQALSSHQGDLSDLLQVAHC